jgi:hypothetical protein
MSVRRQLQLRVSVLNALIDGCSYDFRLLILIELNYFCHPQHYFFVYFFLSLSPSVFVSAQT